MVSMQKLLIGFVPKLLITKNDVLLMIFVKNIDDLDGNNEDHQWLQSTIFQNIDVSLMIHGSLTFGPKRVGKCSG